MVSLQFERSSLTIFLSSFRLGIHSLTISTTLGLTFRDHRPVGSFLSPSIRFSKRISSFSPNSFDCRILLQTTIVTNCCHDVPIYKTFVYFQKIWRSGCLPVNRRKIKFHLSHNGNKSLLKHCIQRSSFSSSAFEIITLIPQLLHVTIPLFLQIIVPCSL